VKNRFKIYGLGFSLLVLLNTSAGAQVLSDTAMLHMIKRGVDYIYNYQFDKASAVYEKIKARFPGHPVPYLYRGMLTYWKYFPLIPSSPALKGFSEDLLTCIDLCTQKKNKAR